MEGSTEGRAAFERLYQRHFEAIYSYVMRRAAMADTADLVADVFATAWRRIADVPADPEEKLWLFGVARRVVSQHHRGKSRRDHLSNKLGRNFSVVTLDSPETSHLEEVVINLIEGLNSEERELVTLIVWDGLTHAEVATILGCSTNAVGIRWHRALKRLRRDIAAATRNQTEQSTLEPATPLIEET
jgi:RNA polymerase sigma-70 factor (ECF subfamily)